MRRFALVLCLSLTTTGFTAFVPDAAATPPGSFKGRAEKHRHVADELLVKFRAGVDPAKMEANAKTHGARSVKRFEHSAGSPLAPWRHVKLGSNINTKVALERLAADPDVEYVEFIYEISIDAVPSDPGFPQLWGLHNLGQDSGVPDADIDAPEAWIS